MTINDEMKIPYVSNDICNYLRGVFDMPNVIALMNKTDNPAIALGMMYGINVVIERLEAIKAQQEENNGIY